MADLRALLGSPSICPLSATERHAEVLAEVLAESGATDNLVDAPAEPRCGGLIRYEDMMVFSVYQ